MNPKDFPWKTEQSVTVTNPTTDDYRFQVYSKWYEVKAGQTAKMPGYIAWLYVYGLACKMSQADKTWSRWNEEGFRDTYYQKIVVAADEVVQVVKPEEPGVEVFGDAVDDLDLDDFDEEDLEDEGGSESEDGDESDGGEGDKNTEVKPMQPKKKNSNGRRKKNSRS